MTYVYPHLYPINTQWYLIHILIFHWHPTDIPLISLSPIKLLKKSAFVGEVPLNQRRKRQNCVWWIWPHTIQPSSPANRSSSVSFCGGTRLGTWIRIVSYGKTWGDSQNGGNLRLKQLKHVETINIWFDAKTTVISGLDVCLSQSIDWASVGILRCVKLGFHRFS